MQVIAAAETEGKMELMKKMVFAACFISIIVTLADSVKPEKFGSQLKLIFSLVFICGMLAAVIGGRYDTDLGLSFDLHETESYASMNAAADSVIVEEAEKSVVEAVQTVLDENDVNYEKITADINIEEDSRISINEIGYKGSEPERAKELIRENIGDTEVRNIE